jgi:hypothetical protein
MVCFRRWCFTSKRAIVFSPVQGWVAGADFEARTVKIEKTLSARSGSAWRPRHNLTACNLDGFYCLLIYRD